MVDILGEGPYIYHAHLIHSLWQLALSYVLCAACHTEEKKVSFIHPGSLLLHTTCVLLVKPKKKKVSCVFIPNLLWMKGTPPVYILHYTPQ